MEYLYLNSLTLHASLKRQTPNFAKVAEKGIIYSPLNKNAVKNTRITKEDERVKFSIDLPEDLQEKIEAGKIIIMIPKEGVPVLASKGLSEFIKSKNGKRLIRKLAENKIED